MEIESRNIVGAAVAFALVGAALWFSTLLFPAERQDAGHVEIVQIPERAWTVEVKDMSAVEQPPATTRTASR